jgi:hypothetical protein
LISREEGVILEGERGRQQESDDMAKIIPMERSNSISRAKGCTHKHVIASTRSRTVRCFVCGEPLDTFDVLVDMISKTIPDGSREKFMRMEREMDHRNRSK